MLRFKVSFQTISAAQEEMAEENPGDRGGNRGEGGQWGVKREREEKGGGQGE